MDLDDFKGVMGSLGLDLWTLIETAISLAARDHGRELRARRDGFVEQLYAAPAAAPCQSRHSEDGPARPGATRAGERERSQSRCTEEERQKLGSSERNRGASPSMALSPDREEEDDDEAAAAAEEEEEEGDRDRRRHSRPVEDEQTKILAIKDLLDDPDQPEDDLVHLLQVLADMDITFRALKGTDIGRHVNGLRKHPSSEVRRLVKQLVRKWKDLVDEWVKSNSHETATPSIITDGDSPQQIQARAGQSRNQVVFGNQNPDVPDFGYSPNTHTVYQTSSDINGGLGSDKPNREVVEPKAKAAPPPRKEAPTKPNHPPSPAPPAQKAEQCREHKDSLLDPERLASARRRLHENYQEAQNAKKQRTIQVMDIHDIPRPKNSFFRGVPGQATVKRKG